MAELSVDDVQDFTNGRLSSFDPETARILEAALVTARQYCGWVVTPVIEDDPVTLDGPGSRILMLPTRKLVELVSIAENGTPLSLASVRSTPGGVPGALSRPAAVRKTSGGWWGLNYQSIDIVMTHGYTEEEAADWRYAVLSMVDEMGQAQIGSSASSDGSGTAVGGGARQLDLVSKTVDDVTYRWGVAGAATSAAAAADYYTAASAALYSSVGVFNNYRLPPVEFL